MRSTTPARAEDPGTKKLQTQLISETQQTLEDTPFYVRSVLSRSEEASTRTPSGGFWLLTGLWCVLFFSLSGSKLPTYILPAFPPLCLGVANNLDPELRKKVE